MSRSLDFNRRSTNGLHSSICLVCFRTAGQSRHSLDLSGYEMTHECNPSDLVYLTDQPSPISYERIDASCIPVALEPELLLPQPSPHIV